MFNLGAPEVLVILLLALIVLGPSRLPDAAKQVGKAMSELRKLSSGFQNELKTAFDDETEAAARRRGAAAEVTPVLPEVVTDVPVPPASPVPSAKTPAPTDAAPTPARPRRSQPLRATPKKPT